MNSPAKRALLPAFACAALILVHGPRAYAAQPAGFVVTTGSVFMNDEFTSTGPSGTIWQPLITRQEIGLLRFELTALQQKDVVTSAGSVLVSSGPPGQAGSGPSAAAGSTAFSVTYALPVEWGWHTTVAAKRYVSSPYQKTQLAIADYDSLLLAATRIAGEGSIESGLGYKFKKELAGYAVHSGAYGYVGGTYELHDSRSVELFLDYRQSDTGAGGFAAEVSAKFIQSIGRNGKVEFYATQGLTRLNRDTVAGLMLNLGF